MRSNNKNNDASSFGFSFFISLNAQGAPLSVGCLYSRTVSSGEMCDKQRVVTSNLNPQ